jgi:hypothetical protein
MRREIVLRTLGGLAGLLVLGGIGIYLAWVFTRVSVDTIPEREIVFTTMGDQDDVLSFVNADGDDLVTLSLRHTIDLRPTWSIDGNSLLVRRARDHMRLFGTPMMISSEGHVLECPILGEGRVWGVGGTNVVLGNLEREVILLDMETCQTLDTLYQNGSAITDVAVSSQDRLAIVSGGFLRVVAPDGQDVFYERGGSGPAWSPDGEWMAFVSNLYENSPAALRTESAAIFVVRRDGSERRYLVEPGNSPSWSPAGRQIIFCAYSSTHQDNLIRRIDVETGEITDLFEGGCFPDWRWGWGDGDEE